MSKANFKQLFLDASEGLFHFHNVLKSDLSLSPDQLRTLAVETALPLGKLLVELGPRLDRIEQKLAQIAKK